MSELVTRTCAQCGVEFSCTAMGSRRRKYCSKRCLTRSKKATRAEWEKRTLVEQQARRKAYREANRDRLIPLHKAYYHANRERLLAQMQEKFQTARLKTPWRYMIFGAKSRAKAKGIPFDLTEEWAQARWTGRCELTDIEFTLGRPKNDPRMFSPSIDKIDPKKGYTQDNCRFILHGVNALKGEETDENMFLIATVLASKATKLHL